ncbi:hypothetical protein, partial [Candidatus Similichlamydia epinepheli]|uniref:hypothetical protein n=1 Tax=Candidatus Similichlamydia epinepheli TaxID=1903953 RepID=UPI00195E6A41
EWMIAVNGFVSSCFLNRDIVDLKHLAESVAKDPVFSKEKDSSSPLILLIWCLRLRSVSLYEAACARQQVEEIMKRGDWQNCAQK